MRIQKKAGRSGLIRVPPVTAVEAETRSVYLFTKPCNSYSSSSSSSYQIVHTVHRRPYCTRPAPTLALRLALTLQLSAIDLLCTCRPGSKLPRTPRMRCLNPIIHTVRDQQHQISSCLGLRYWLPVQNLHHKKTQSSNYWQQHPNNTQAGRQADFV